MPPPPRQLDGAEVLSWVVSENGSFYQLTGCDPAVTIVAMAVARYVDGGPFYLFKCDSGWEVHQDWDCDSVEEAQQLAATHAGEPLPLKWRTWH